MMASFELRGMCNELLAELNESTNKKNIIKLGVDIQLPDIFYGSPHDFLHLLRSLTSYLADRLINGIIAIEITLQACHGNDTALHVHISGKGSNRVDVEDNLNILLQQLGNKISSKKEEGKITFEFNHTLQGLQIATSHTQFPFQNRKILLAEDNEINSIVFTSFLEEWGCESSVAINGAEAVSMVHDGHYDAILMDIHMPVLNGNQATIKIREFNPSIPIIALTASTREDDIREALQSGVNDYLLKPVSSANLFKVLSRYL